MFSNVRVRTKNVSSELLGAGNAASVDTGSTVVGSIIYGGDFRHVIASELL